MLWFTEFDAGKVGEFFSVNKTAREFSVPGSHSQPAGLAMDREGKIWFADESGNGSIWRFDPSTQEFKQYELHTANATPVFILIDLSSNIWFTELTGNKLGELVYPDYTMREYSVPTANAGPVELALQSSKQTIWFTETYSSRIGEFDIPSGSFREFTPSVSLRAPVGIVLDQSGDVWVSEHGGSSIVEFNPSNSTYRKYPTSEPSASAGYQISAPATLALDGEGRLWFVEHFSNKVGRLDPRMGTLDEFTIPTQGAYSILNTLDQQGNFWFTRYSGNSIGMIRFNATSPFLVRTQGRGVAELTAGKTIEESVVLTNNESSSLDLTLNATSSFTATGQTSTKQVSINPSVITLGPHQNTTVTITITPDSDLSSGPYSVGVVASAGSISTIGMMFFLVHGGLPLLSLIAANPQIAALVVLLPLGIAYLLLRRRRIIGKSTRIVRALNIPTLGLILLTILISTSALHPAYGKCPGLPVYGPGGPDYIGIAFDSLLWAIIAFLAYGLYKELRRKRALKGQGGRKMKKA